MRKGFALRRFADFSIGDLCFECAYLSSRTYDIDTWKSICIHAEFREFFKTECLRWICLKMKSHLREKRCWWCKWSSPRLIDLWSPGRKFQYEVSGMKISGKGETFWEKVTDRGSCCNKKYPHFIVSLEKIGYEIVV